MLQVVFENWPVDCQRINRIRARCIMPMFHKTGLVPIRMSRNGGQSFPFVGWFYVRKSMISIPFISLMSCNNCSFLSVQPFRSNYKVQLWDSVQNPQNRWDQPNPDTLTMQWQFLNLTYNANARVDVNLYGYWEDADR